jgi:hypothetical protein
MRLAWRGPTSTIKLQILLRSEWRTPEGLEKVQAMLRALGMAPTAAGAVTISAEVEPDKFQKMFGVTITATPPQPPGKGDFGKSGGNVSPDLKVPAALSDFVASISTAPGHYYLQN